MNILIGDFETRTAGPDLKKCGVEVYGDHPTTEMLCFGYAFDEGPARLVLAGESLPEEVASHIKGGGTFIAHNAPFELAIWNRVCVKKYGWPPLRPEQVICTMAMAYAMSLPGSLEQAAQALNLPIQKDMQGHRIMLQLSGPRDIKDDGTIVWWDSTEAHKRGDKEKVDGKYKALYEYCLKDVEAERVLYKRLRHLSTAERKLWLIDRRINDRGVRIDTRLLQAAQKLVEFEKHRLDAEMRKVTKNGVAGCSAVGQLGDWLRFRGVEMPSVARADVLDALATDRLPPDCKKALELRQEGSRLTSCRKLLSMSLGAGSDGRVRGCFQYHGANTGRWAGRRIQLHNLPRPKIKDEQIERTFELLEAASGHAAS